jgi:hypothetical protein
VRDSERERRAAQRRATAILHRARLKPSEADVHPIAGAEAISLVWTLTRTSWSLSGAPMPAYSRETIPVRFVPGRLT